MQPGFGKQIVEGFQQAHVVDRLAKQVQDLQPQQVADVIHVGMPRHDDHRQVLARGVLAQALDQRQAAFLGHAQVSDYQRDIRMPGEVVQGKLDRGGSETAETLAFEQLGKFQ